MPTEVIGDNTGDDYTGVEDTRLSLDAATTNYASDYLEVAKWTATSDELDTWIFFPLTSIPASATFSAATVSLYRYDGSANDYTVDIFRCLRNAVEAQATWDDYATSTAWTSGGGRGSGTDRTSSTIATFATGTSNGYKTSSDITSEVQDWYDGTNSNYGMLMERNGTGNFQYHRFRQSEGTDGQRPYMTVTYTTGAAASVSGTHSLLGVGF